MIANLFNTFVYIPLYNALIAIHSLGAWVDIGIAIVILTIIVRLVLAPLSLKAARTQRIMRDLEYEPGQSFQEDIARAMQTQVLYVLPVLIVVFGYITSAAVALYWVTSNLCSIFQEWYVQHTLRVEGGAATVTTQHNTQPSANDTDSHTT
jgi:membrane protein insertase Oxa1/YidC/SpoIIIJ